MKPLRVLVVVGAGVSAAALGVVAAGAVTPARTSATPQHGGSVTIARREDSESFDLTSVFDNESIWLGEQIMEPLYIVTPTARA